MKKFIAIVIILLAAIGFYYIERGDKESITQHDVLETLGYTKSEITTINKQNCKITKYNENIPLLIQTKGFACDKLDTYLAYITKFSVPVVDTIYLVNNGITDTYNEKILQIMNEKYYVKSRLERYLSYLDKNTDFATSEIVKNVNSNLDYDFYTNINRTDLSLDNLIIINKYYYLEKDYEPNDLITLNSSCYSGNAKKLKKEAAEAFNELCAASKKDGVTVKAVSAYRSYSNQLGLYNGYVKRDGVTAADTYSARAGYSEHQTGLAVDVNVVNETFANTKAYEWMIAHSYEYGYILRYPKGLDYLTGYKYEPWHYRYVGKEVAKFINENNLTYEEYYAYYIAK